MTSEPIDTFSFGADLDISDLDIVELYASQRQFGYWTRPYGDEAAMVSKQICTILEIEKEPESISRDDVVKAVYPEDQPAVVEAMRKAVAGKQPFEYTYRVAKPDGSLKQVRTLGGYRVNKDGAEEMYGITYTLFPNIRSVGFIDAN